MTKIYTKEKIKSDNKQAFSKTKLKSADEVSVFAENIIDIVHHSIGFPE